ncbi:MAG: NUDIX domain-containing protein [Rhodobacteraceae bacterium]|nr:NUDIX domain-containing protein [Paracoccaceae bacterium]
MRPADIKIVVALIINDADEMLLVRKRGSAFFMQPGGKLDAGESDLDALCRELREEVNLTIDPSRFSSQGVYRDWAANEPGKLVEAMAFSCFGSFKVSPAAEIEEVRWVPLEEEPAAIQRAALSKNHLFPLARRLLRSSAVAG